MKSLPLLRLMGSVSALFLLTVLSASAASPPIVVRAHDWVKMPATGDLSLTETQQAGPTSYIARVNFLRWEPGDSGRAWILDGNGNLYILPEANRFADRTALLDAAARDAQPYLDFNGSLSGQANDRNFIPGDEGTTPAAPDGIFRMFSKQVGYAGGLITFAFDPEYPENGRFYTVHMERNSGESNTHRIPLGGPGTKHPGLDVSDYAFTPMLQPFPGTTSGIQRQVVLIEWTDTSPANTTFEGTAREILRLGYHLHIHPLGDLIFNPHATDPSHPDWGVLYLANGEGSAGEQNNNRTFLPQRLDSHLGKVLRIIPDLSRQTETSTVSANGRYRIPQDNPFYAVDGALREIWTLGHRNPHRFAWDGPTDTLLVSEIGQREWEEVNIIERGLNYGYAEREGPERFIVADRSTEPVPEPDLVPIRLTQTTILGHVTPTYPVIAYPHTEEFGDAIANGYVYRGTAIPALTGRFVFGDITTGRLWHADFDAMLAAHAQNEPFGHVPVEPLHIEWADPAAANEVAVYDSFFPIALAAYTARGGKDIDLPGSARISGSGRVDIRLAVDPEGELFVLSKSDGMIRALTAPPEKDAWLAEHFSPEERADPSLVGDLATPGGDGLPNLLKYALGLDPRRSATHALPLWEGIHGDRELVFTPLRPELRYTVEASKDLATWSTKGVTVETDSDGQQRARFHEADANQYFLRLSVRPRYE